MHRRSLVNLVLALSLVTLGALAWLRPGIKAPTAVFEIVKIELSTLQSIRAEKNGQLKYSLENTAGVWRLTAPFGAAADPLAIKQLVDKTRLTSEDRYAAHGVNLDELGLSQPFMKFVFDGDEILVGNNEPISQRRYVKSGDWIYLVSGLAIFSLDRKAEGFVLEQSADSEPAESD